MTTESPFHSDVRRILGDTEYEIVCAKAAILDRLMQRLHVAFVDDTRRFYLSPENGPKCDDGPAPEAPPDAPTAPEPAPAAQPGPTPTPSADELLSPPVRRGRGRPRKVQPEPGAVPSPQPGPELESADIGADRASDDDFFAAAPEPATAPNDDADDAPDFLDGLD